tara:strand:- start:806 stop:1408 length:603 start_codon:yes stop_codon:yes gene_type:complete
MSKHIDSWKNSKSVFDQQLYLNLQELNGQYPPHWNSFKTTLNLLNPKRVVDVGCGAGVYSYLTRKQGIEYIGYDYSEHAVNLAKQKWKDNFQCKDYKDLTTDDIMPEDLVVANGLCDILPDGDDCVNHLLNLNSDYLLLQRIRLTDRKSYSTEYEAYSIITYEFFHNEKEFDKKIFNSGYKSTKTLLYKGSSIYDVELTK